MANIFDAAEDFITSALGDFLSVSVEYRRGATMETIDVSTGGQQYEMMQEYGVFSSGQANDFIVAASALDTNFGGEPLRGDIIAWTIDGTTHLFECSGPGDERHYVVHGQGRQRWRIHTKYIGEE